LLASELSNGPFACPILGPFSLRAAELIGVEAICYLKYLSIGIVQSEDK
jgi:hypothetical protein